MNEDHRLHPFHDYTNSSFVELLRRQSPHLLPGGTASGAAWTPQSACFPLFAADARLNRPRQPSHPSPYPLPSRFAG